MHISLPGGCGVARQTPTMSGYIAILFPGKTPESTRSEGFLGPSATVHFEQNLNVFSWASVA